MRQARTHRSGSAVYIDANPFQLFSRLGEGVLIQVGLLIALGTSNVAYLDKRKCYGDAE